MLDECGFHAMEITKESATASGVIEAAEWLLPLWLLGKNMMRRLKDYTVMPVVPVLPWFGASALPFRIFR